MSDIYDRLLDMQEVTYGDFAAKLLPTIARERVIGVRLPLVHKYAKQIRGTEQAAQFMKDLPHTYLEENHLHAYLISQMHDAQACFAALDAFLPYVDSRTGIEPNCPRAMHLCVFRRAFTRKIGILLRKISPKSIKNAFALGCKQF